MRCISETAKKRALPRHQQAFRTWVQYGLPLLSTKKYVSDSLSNWIFDLWKKLLTEDGTLGSVIAKYGRFDEERSLELKKYSSHFFIQEYAEIPESSSFKQFIADENPPNINPLD